jgi:hypothetical protein
MTRGFRSAAVTAACAAAVLFPAGLASATATAPATGLSIHTILGPGHLSPYAGQAVSGVPGVVTDVTSSAFYLQDPARVGGTPFKQAIEVYTGKKPTVVAGDDVTVAGTVSEFYPDQADTPSALPIAEIDSPTVTVTSTGNPLPAPVVIGARGVLPPAQDIYGGRTSRSRSRRTTGRARACAPRPAAWPTSPTPRSTPAAWPSTPPTASRPRRSTWATTSPARSRAS